MSPAYRSVSPSALDDHAGDGGAGRVGFQLHRPRVPQQGDVVVLEGGPDADHLGVGLGVQRAREAVAFPALHAGAVGQVGLVDQDPARGVERMVALLLQVVGELLDARLMRDRGVRVGRARRRLGRVLPPRPVHLIEVLGGRVVRLHVLIGDGPGGRQPVVVLQLAEVLLAHAVQRGAVQLGGAADEVVHLRLEERLVLGAVPVVGRDVAAVHEHVQGGPVLRLAGQPVAAFEQQDALARRGEVAGERAAARPGPDDDDVITFCHVWLLLSNGRAPAAGCRVPALRAALGCAGRGGGTGGGGRGAGRNCSRLIRRRNT